MRARPFSLLKPTLSRLQNLDERLRVRGSRSRSYCGGGTLLLETFAAEYRTSLRRFKGYSSFLAAFRTNGASFNLRVCTGGGDTQGRRALRLAGFTTLGFVFELLIVEEKLLTGGEDKVGAAVDTLENLVLKFHRTPFKPRPIVWPPWLVGTLPEIRAPVPSYSGDRLGFTP
jgi:hypothetical protein